MRRQVAAESGTRLFAAYDQTLGAHPHQRPPSIDRILSSRRVLVLGPSGGGKTRLALWLRERLNFELIHLDAHFWKPGWISTPQTEWRDIVVTLTEREQWIMDGTYESTLDLRIPRADAIILIEDNRWNCLYRAFRRRVLADRQVRPDAPARQKLDGPFLRYIWNYSLRTRPKILEALKRYDARELTFVLRGQRGIRSFMHELEVGMSKRTG
jgi:adenylate kinase family enzyme